SRRTLRASAASLLSTFTPIVAADNTDPRAPARPQSAVIASAGLQTQRRDAAPHGALKFVDFCRTAASRHHLFDAVSPSGCRHLQRRRAVDGNERTIGNGGMGSRQRPLAIGTAVADVR